MLDDFAPGDAIDEHQRDGYVLIRGRDAKEFVRVLAPEGGPHRHLVIFGYQVIENRIWAECISLFGLPLCQLRPVYATGRF